MLVVINDSKRDKKIKIKGGYENIQEIVTTQTRNWETQEYKYNGYITSKAKSVTTYIMTNPVIEG